MLGTSRMITVCRSRDFMNSFTKWSVSAGHLTAPRACQNIAKLICDLWREVQHNDAEFAEQQADTSRTFTPGRALKKNPAVENCADFEILSALRSRTLLPLQNSQTVLNASPISRVVIPFVSIWAMRARFITRRGRPSMRPARRVFSNRV